MIRPELLVEAAHAVHRELGPGLLEAAYEQCLVHELAARRIRVERQVVQEVRYRGIRVPSAYRVDLLVERTVIVEIKTVDRLQRIHAAQVLSYLRLSGLPLALLINFNVPCLRRGIRWFLHTPRRRGPWRDAPSGPEQPRAVRRC
jgi:GxxExxY protein